MAKWLSKGIYPERHIILVVGHPGSYKSWLVTQLAIDAAKGGRKHLGKFDIEPGHKVIHIDEDTPTDVYDERYRRLAKGAGCKIKDLSIVRRSNKGFRLFDDKQRRALINDIVPGTIIILDCLVKIMAGKNLDTVTKASEVMGYLTELRDAGATVIVIHHISLKKEVTVGMWNPMAIVLDSTMLISGCDTAFTLLKVPVEEESLFVIMPESRRLSLKVEKPFAVELKEKGGGAWLAAIEEIPYLPSEDAKLIFQMFPDNSSELTIRELDNKLQEDLTKNRIRLATTELAGQLCLERRVDPHSKNHAAYYSRHPKFNLLNNYYKKHLVVTEHNKTKKRKKVKGVKTLKA